MFVSVLMEQAKTDEKIFLITPDMGFSVFEPFMETYPDRFLNVGVAEQNAIGIAVGLAFSGFKPFVYSIAPFMLMRCYEQVRLGAAYMQANIKIVGSGGGVAYGPQGTTHHIIEDFAIAKVLPGMIVCAPADSIEARQIFEQSVSIMSPMYIRIAKNDEPLIHGSDDRITIGKAFSIEHGDDIEILTTGTFTYRVREWLPEIKKQDISAGLTVFPTIKPLNTDYLDELIKTGKDILVCEEHNIIGGLGESICSYMKQKDAPNRIRILGIPDQYSHYVGSQPYILEKMGLWQVPDIKELFCKRQ
jgi:transketolase